VLDWIGRNYEPIRPPRGRGEVILYLDYDGVLHRGGATVSRRHGVLPTHAGARLFEYAHLLADDLADFPLVKIVLSTSWQLWRGFEVARRQLPPVLAERVVGGTFHSRVHSKQEWRNTPRGMQIWNDVQSRQPKTWLALDDDVDGWPQWCRNCCVQTDHEVALADPQVRFQLRQRLAQASAED